MSDPFNDNDDDKVDVLATDETLRTFKTLNAQQGFADTQPNAAVAALTVATAIFQTNAILIDLEAVLTRIHKNSERQLEIEEAREERALINARHREERRLRRGERRGGGYATEDSDFDAD